MLQPDPLYPHHNSLDHGGERCSSVRGWNCLVVQQSCNANSLKSICHSISCCHRFGKHQHSLCIPLRRRPASHSLLQQCKQAVSIQPVGGRGAEGCFLQEGVLHAPSNLCIQAALGCIPPIHYKAVCFHCLLSLTPSKIRPSWLVTGTHPNTVTQGQLKVAAPVTCSSSCPLWFPAMSMRQWRGLDAGGGPPTKPDRETSSASLRLWTSFLPMATWQPQRCTAAQTACTYRHPQLSVRDYDVQVHATATGQTTVPYASWCCSLCHG